MPHLVNKCCYFSRGDSVDAKNGITVKSVENDISWCVSENTFSHFSGLGFRLTQRGARGAGRGGRRRQEAGYFRSVSKHLNSSDTSPFCSQR